jgi:RimJ/RimL family protein N-acetyltransferase
MNFRLRNWTINDLDSLVKYANNFQIAKNLTNFFPHPYTLEVGRSFIAACIEATPPNRFAIELAGEAVGAIGIHLQTDIHLKNAELGYWLAEPFWGRGIMTQAITQMTDYGFKTWDIERIFARPFGSNKGSQKALEKAGFVLEARFEKILFKNGEYLDELVYAVRRK